MYGLGGRRAIMCLKGSVAEHSPSKRRGAGIICYRARAEPHRAGRSSQPYSRTIICRETKHLLLSMYRHQGNMLEILSTSNTWRIPHNAPRAPLLQPSALKYAPAPLPRPLPLMYPQLPEALWNFRRAFYLSPAL